MPRIQGLSTTYCGSSTAKKPRRRSPMYKTSVAMTNSRNVIVLVCHVPGMMGIEAILGLRSLAWVSVFANATVPPLLVLFLFFFFPIGIGTLDVIHCWRKAARRLSGVV